MAEGSSWPLGPGDFDGFHIYKDKDVEEAKALEVEEQVEKKRLRDELKRKSKLVERVTLTSLPDKPCTVQAGSFVRAKIVHIISPWEFFVIPEKNWGCISSYNYDQDAGWSHLLKLQDKLSRHKSSEKCVEFKVNDLVCVRHQDINLSIISGKPNRGFHRGLITQDYSTTEDNESPPNVHLILLDYGIELRVPLADVHVLHPKFATLPTLVYKCMLHGLSPIGVGKWDKETINRFRELCLNKVCVLEIKSCDRSTNDNSGVKLYENENPYQVTVKVKDKENSYLNVGKKLISSHLAIAWNPMLCNVDTQDIFINSDAAHFILGLD